MSAIKTANLPEALSAPAQRELEQFDSAYQGYLQGLEPDTPPPGSILADAPMLFILWVLRDGICHGCQDFRKVFAEAFDIDAKIGRLVADGLLTATPDSHGKNVNDWFHLTAVGMDAISSFPQTPDQKILWQELQQIALRRHANLGMPAPDKVKRLPRDQEAYQEAARQEMVGLAFSGGGIRSATFNLGILQGLAKLGLLKYVDYLSTVSGGGYIGSWLSAWVQREGLATVERELHPNRIDQAPPDGVSRPQAAAGEPGPLFHLRRYSNYLAPKLGLLSADMWVLFAIYLRNFLVCQLFLFPVVVAVLLLSRLFMVLYHTDTPSYVAFQTPDVMRDFVAELLVLNKDDPTSVIKADQWLLGLIVAIFWLATAWLAFLGSGWVRPEDAAGDATADKKRLSLSSLRWYVAFPLLVTAVLFCWLPALQLHELNQDPGAPEREKWLALGMPWWEVSNPEAQGNDEAAKKGIPDYLAVRKSVRDQFVAFLVIPALVVLAAYFLALPFHRRWREVPLHVICVTLATMGGSILLFMVWNFLIWLCKSGPGELDDYVQARAAARVTTFGPPLILGVFLLTIYLGIALLGKHLGEELREWWSNLCAWLMSFAVLWMLINAVAIYATAVVIWAGPWLRATLASGWAASVLAGVFAGWSGTTSGKKQRKSPLDWLAGLAPPIFVAGLLVGFSLFIHVFLDCPPNWEHGTDNAEWMRRDDPAHPPIRVIETKAKPNVLRQSVELKEISEKSRVFDESAVLSRVYWMSIFNTDPTWVPQPKYQLQTEDIRYLRKQRRLRPELAELLRENVAKADQWEKKEHKSIQTAEEFRLHFKPFLAKLPTAATALPGEVTQEEIVAIATDAVLIKFDPGVLLGKFGAALLVCLLLLLIASLVVDVNRFSLHALYANRLTRCYLGASNHQRSPDPVTGFDPADDLKLEQLQHAKGYQGPYLLVNTALNLVAGKELAWQERMAESFVLTPLTCGCPDTGYCDSAIYSDGLRLSTAMTISGAAASPNSGYHSSPAVTALLTVFNARLGAWLGNPKRPSRWRDQSPRGGFLYLLKELFGQTTSESAYVYLSDGGHFENLAVYELVRRRCRYIIVSDADCDPDHLFEDVGNLIRKVRSDFGIRIVIDLEALKLAADSGRTRWHCAVGKIHYEDVDFGAIPGIIIYVKPSLIGDESADILHYQAAHPTFPHETTLDQFFSESQFESYRALGQHIAEWVLADALDDVNSEIAEDRPATARAARRITCRALFTSVLRRWFALPPGYESSFVETTLNYIDLQKSFAEDAELHPITQGIYPELPAAAAPKPAPGPKVAEPVDSVQPAVELPAPAPAADSRPVPDPQLPATSDSGQSSVELHTLLRMFQILENAWLSLHLDVCYAHPLNRGWMDVFYRWTTSPLFAKHWPVLRAEFSRGFVEFCERQLRTGFVEIVTEELVDTLVPHVLTHEFRAQWPGHDLQARWDNMKGAGQGWLIYSRMKARPDLAAKRVPIGIILMGPGMAEKPRMGDVHEFLIWIRGSYRNTGIGRDAVRNVLRELTKKWPGKTFRLRVVLPISQLQGPGGELLKAMWLAFFHHLGFERVAAVKPLPSAWPSVAAEEDIILEGTFGRT